jgi:transketolase
VVGAGVTLHEALTAYDELRKENISIGVVDVFSVQPIDKDLLSTAAGHRAGALWLPKITTPEAALVTRCGPPSPRKTQSF